MGQLLSDVLFENTNNDIEIILYWFCSVFQMMIAAAKNARMIKDNQLKLQREREELQELITLTMSEVLSDGTFSSLSSWITKNQEEKLSMEQAILR